MQNDMNLFDKPINVCFIGLKAYPLFNTGVKEVFGGAEVDLYFLATELAKDEKFNVSFVTADYGQDEIETIEGVRVIKSLDFKNNLISGTVKLWRAMNYADTQIYMMKTIPPGMFLVALFCRLKNKAFLYRTPSAKVCDSTYFKKRPLLRTLFKWALRNTAIVFTQSETDSENLQHTIGISSIVIPNGIRLNDLSKKQRNIFLWVGRSARVKRPELFIRLAEAFPEQEFVMICQHATGDKKYHELRKQAEKADNLKFIHSVPFNEVDDYFRQAKVFVNTSEAEGFPNTFIQACKAGTAILSLKVNPDGFLDDYNCGICCNDDFGTSIDALKSLIEGNRYVNLGKNARKYVEQKHNIANIVQIYKNIIKDLVNKQIQ